MILLQPIIQDSQHHPQPRVASAPRCQDVQVRVDVIVLENRLKIGLAARGHLVELLLPHHYRNYGLCCGKGIASGQGGILPLYSALGGTSGVCVQLWAPRDRGGSQSWGGIEASLTGNS